jgi:uncharacterized lipoprotein YehR (DUF1307 family)
MTNARFDIERTMQRSRRIAAVVIAAVLVLALSGCCSMSKRPIPGICATDVARAS